MRIYFDENFSPALIAGVRAFQDGRRSEDVTVVSVADEFGKGTADEVWIPGIAQRHGVVITQDLNIHRMRAQAELCRSNKIGVFFIRPPKQGWNYWQIIQFIVKLWPEFKEETKRSMRPFGFIVEFPKGKFMDLQS